MDTKLKNNKKVYVLILFATLLIIASICTYLGYYNSKNKWKIEGANNSISNILNDLEYLHGVVVDLDGNIRPEAIENEKKAYKNELLNNLQALKDEKAQFVPEGVVTEYTMRLDNNIKHAEEQLNQDDETMSQKAETRVKNNIESYLSNIRNSFNIEFYYETDNPEKPLTNVPGVSKEDFVKDTKANYSEYALLYGNNSSPKEVKTNYGLNLFNNNYSGYDKYVRINNELVPGDTIYYQLNTLINEAKLAKYGLMLMVVNIVCLIITSVLLIKDSKKKTWQESKAQEIYSKIYLEFKAFIVLITLTISIFAVGDVCYEGDILGTFLVIIFISLILSLIFYYTIGDMYFSYKNRKRIRENSLIFRLIRPMKNMGYKFNKLVKDIMKEKSTVSQTLVALGILTVYIFYMTFTIHYAIIENYVFIRPINAVLTIIAIISTYGIYKFILLVAANINNIKEMTDSIVKGDYKNRIDIKSNGVMKEITNNLCNIENGLNDAVSKAVSSEKMKGELITNVSHDLKTPLTSIINYVDLLSKDNVSKEEQDKYIEVLKEKSQRLKVLIEDLFEVSKASSGTMELNMEKIDPVALLRQTIGEFEDKIEESNLEFIKTIPDEKLEVYADGRKTFRVYQNLISNILKYSLKGSRVYINFIDEDHSVDIIFRNISAHQITFNEEEIVERFKRGDSSRTTEGSGLGLAIAKSLVELQGGEFEIVIDGDLFKAIVKLKKN